MLSFSILLVILSFATESFERTVSKTGTVKAFISFAANDSAEIRHTMKTLYMWKFDFKVYCFILFVLVNQVFPLFSQDQLHH